MLKKLAIGLGSAIVIAAIVICSVPLKTVSYTVTVPYQTTETYYEHEPYQVEEPYNYTHSVNDKIFANGTSLLGGFDYPLSIYLEPYGAIVKGIVREHTGYGIDFYVFLEGGYYAWKLGQPNLPLVHLSNVTSEFFSFAPPVSGDYYFVLSNRNSSRDKMAYLEAYYYHSVTEQRYRTITKYRDIEKQRTITKYRQETHYKSVTILEYLTSY